MKNYLKIIIYAAIAVVIATLLAVSITQGRHLKSLKIQVTEQSAVIDSLLKRRMTVFDVTLNVTDKSTNKIYGRYNKGTIQMPSTKSYVLEMDSVNMNVRN
ncbi:MAG: hypothetical protein IJR53_06785 [Bacteroidales bacterium]|nr:hypothetical protein [Bacteroidales bacterium]